MSLFEQNLVDVDFGNLKLERLSLSQIILLGNPNEGKSSLIACICKDEKMLNVCSNKNKSTRLELIRSKFDRLPPKAMRFPRFLRNRFFKKSKTHDILFVNFGGQDTFFLDRLNFLLNAYKKTFIIVISLFSEDIGRDLKYWLDIYYLI